MIRNSPGGRGAGFLSLTAVAAMIALHALFWFRQPTAFLDDVDSQHYARLADEMAEGRFSLAAHPFNHRFGVTVPAALAYRTLGVGARRTTVWPLLASCLTIIVTYAAARRSFGNAAGLLAALLLATNPVQVQYAAHLLPDLIASLFLVVGLALVLRARERDSARPAALAAAAGGALVLAMLTKETVLWTVPFYAILMLRDLRRGRNRRLWASLAGTGAAAAVAFLAVYHLVAGDALARLHGIDATHNARVWSFAGRGKLEVLHRLTHRPIRFLATEPGYLPLVLLALPVAGRIRRFARGVPEAARVWAAYALTVLLGYWFGTTSLRFYNPLPLADRYAMPLIAPLCVVGGATLAAALARIARPAARRGAAAAIVIAAVGALAAQAAGGLGAVNPMRAIERDFVRRNLSDLPDPTLIVTDRHSRFVLPFLLSPAMRERVHFADLRGSWLGTDECPEPAAILLYLHEVRLWITRRNWGWDVPESVAEVAAGPMIDDRVLPGPEGLRLRLCRISGSLGDDGVPEGERPRFRR